MKKIVKGSCKYPCKWSYVNAFRVKILYNVYARLFNALSKSKGLPDSGQDHIIPQSGNSMQFNLMHSKHFKK